MTVKAIMARCPTCDRTEQIGQVDEIYVKGDPDRITECYPIPCPEHRPPIPSMSMPGPESSMDRFSTKSMRVEAVVPMIVGFIVDEAKRGDFLDKSTE